MSARLARLLVRLFPPAFRAEFGPDLVHLFAERWGDARGWSGMRLRVRLLADLVVSAGREWRAALAAGRARSSRVRGVAADLAHDAVVAFRRQRAEPAFSAAVIGLLALGIGATTTMFSALDAALLRPLPFAEPERLVSLTDIEVPFQPDPSEPAHVGPRPTLPAVQAMPDFSSAAMYAAGGLNLADPDNPVRVRAGVVTAGFFETLGIRPAMGRTFAAEEGVPRGPAAVMLSHGLWLRHFGGDAVIGHRLQLGKRGYTIVGVMPRGFSFPNESDLWVVLTIPATFDSFEAFRGFLPTRTMARVAPGVPVAAAEARLRTAWEQALSSAATPGQPGYQQETLDRIRSQGALAPLGRTLAADRRATLLILFGATSLLLVVACANVSNLLLARSSLRRRELAVLAALGASRGRIARQLLTESALLAATGAALGLATAPLALRAVTAVMPPSLAGLAPPRVDLRVMAFTAAVAVLTGIGVGLWPVVRDAGVDAMESIKSGGWGLTGARSGARRALVAVELALTLPLLVGAGLTLKSLERLLATNSGLDLDRAAALEFAFSADKSPAHREAIVTAALDRLRAIPGVEAAGVVNDLPLGGAGGIALRIEPDAGPAGPREPVYPRYLTASDGYFRALGIPLLAGRLFTRADDSAGPPVVIVNHRLARQLWGDADPVGRTFRFPPNPDKARPFTVIGLVGDVREGGLDREPSPQMFLSAYAGLPFNLALVARGNLPDAALLGHLRDAIRAADPSQPVIRLRMMDDVLGTAVAPRRANTLLVTVFGGLGLLVAALGVYGVVAYGVVRRRRELGIRGALGAGAGDLVGLVVKEMMGATGIGMAAGLGAAWAMGRVVESQLYGVTARDGATFLTATAVLLAAVVVATVIPALRALRINPADAMRAE